MIRSMTGFGRAAIEVDGIAVSVEVRTVNHRHLDSIMNRFSIRDVLDIDNPPRWRLRKKLL